MKTRLILLLVCAAAPAGWAVTATDQVRLADGLFARGMYELALREYRAVADQTSLTNRDVVLYRMAESERALGRVAESDALYEQVITGFPTRVVAQRAALRRAESALESGRFEEVVRVLSDRKEADLEPEGRAAWRYFLAHAEQRLDHPKKAEPLYRRLLKDEASSAYAPFARLELAELVQAREPASPEIRTLLEAVVQAGPANPAGRQAALKLAGHLYAQKDYAGSADAYAALVQHDPALVATVRVASAWSHFKAERWNDVLALTVAASDPDSLYLQANSLRQLQRAEEAARVYRSLLEQHPGHALSESARYEAAVLALSSRDFKAARQLAAAVPSTPQRAEDLLWIQAEAARGEGDVEAALRWYDQLVREIPAGEKASAARFYAARLTQEQGRWEEASVRYRAVADDPRGRTLAADALYASAFARMQLDQRAEAVNDWARLQKEHADFARLDEVLYARAHAEVSLDRPADARVQLDTLLKQFPKSTWVPEAHYLLGTVLERDEKWEAAEYHYRLATRGQAEEGLIRRIEFRRVAVLQRQGRNDEAAQALNKLLAQSAGGQGVPAALLDWLARWNADQQRWPEAEKAALALSEQGPAWELLAWYQVGRAREEQGNAEGARAAYRTSAVVSGGREATDSAYRLGRLAAAARDGAEARTYLTRAAEQASDESMADLRARSYMALAGLDEQEGRAEDALRTLLSVALLYDDPELTPEALYRAAGHLQTLGRGAEREQTLQELKQRYPDSPWAQRAAATP